MATTPIIGKVTVGGTSKTISGGYVNIGGVWKPIAKTYVNVNGVWENAWKDLYTWKKYRVKSEKVYAESKASTITQETLSKTDKVYCGKGYTFNTSTGKYTLQTTKSGTVSDLSSATYKYFMFGTSKTGTTMCEVNSKSTSTVNDSVYLKYYLYTTTYSTKQVQGTYIEDVTAENASAYPTNGVHTDGYWYVKQ